MKFTALNFLSLFGKIEIKQKSEIEKAQTMSLSIYDKLSDDKINIEKTNMGYFRYFKNELFKAKMWYFWASLMCFLCWSMRTTANVTRKLELYFRTSVDVTLPLMEDTQKPWSEQDHYNVPLLDLWNKTAMNDSIVNHKQTEDAQPKESQWLNVPINQSFFDWRRANSSSTYPSIPKLIHKVYIQKNGKFPSVKEKEEMRNLEKAHKSWILANPGYHTEAYNLLGCRKYLATNFHPVFLQTFDCLSAFAAKADFFRMAVVYLEGGWYSDWKQVCLRDGLLESLGSNVSLYVVWDKGNPTSINDKCLQNAFFGASPFHPAIAIMLKMIMSNVCNEFYGKLSLHATSPCLFSKAYKEFVDKQNPSKNGVREGTFVESQRLKYLIFPIKGTKSEPVIQHKCDGCGTDQNWAEGNNHNALHKQKTYYCPDAKSLYESTNSLRK